MTTTSMNKGIAKLASIFVLGAFAIACSHAHPRGSVVLKHSKEEVDVCIGSNEIQVGDKVAFFETTCVGSIAGNHGNGHIGGKKCSKKKVGEGEVIKLVDEHFSTVKLAEDFKVTEGTVVERQ